METAIIVACISALGSLGVAWISHRIHKTNKTTAEEVAEVKAQVQNSHDTNLRDDIDRVLDGIAALVEGQRRHDAEIAGLRTDLRIERQERLALADRIFEGR